MFLALVVAARVLANPVSNVFQKQLAQRAAHPLFVIAATHAVLSIAAVPALLRWPPPAFGRAFWSDAVAAAVLAVSGNALLVAALKRSDLSLLGPVNAYKAVVSLGLAAVLVGEVPTALGLAGVLLILGGSALVIERGRHGARGGPLRHFFTDPGVRLRLAALVLSATEAVFLKRALHAAPPAATFLVWCVLGLAVAGPAAAVLLGPAGLERERSRWRGSRPTYLSLAATTAVMQLTTLLTFGVLQVGYSLALFQLSSLVSVVLGWRYFDERHAPRRLAGAAVMVAGAVAIVMAETRSP